MTETTDRAPETTNTTPEQTLAEDRRKLRAQYDDEAFEQWVAQKNAEATAQLTPEELHIAARVGISPATTRPSGERVARCDT